MGTPFGFVRVIVVCESTPGIWGAPQMFVETLPVIVSTSRGLRVPLRSEGCLAAAVWAPGSRSAPGAAPERSRKGRGGRAGCPRAGRPACVGCAGLAGGAAPQRPPRRAAPRPLWLWRGREAWAASPNCSWRPSRRWRLPRTRRSCLNHRPRALPAAHVRRPPRPSSSPYRPQLSAGVFGFSAVSRTLAARRGWGKCAPAVVGSNLP